MTPLNLIDIPVMQEIRYWRRTSSGWKQFLDKGVSNSQDFIEELHKVASAYGVEIDKIIKDTGSMESR